MIRVHHLENSRSQRILWLLEELGLEYEVVHYARDPETMLAPPALRAIHPLGKSPVVEDAGDMLAESAAICEILVQRHGKDTLWLEPGSTEWARSLYWLHFAEGSAMPPLLMKLVFDRIRRTRTPFFVKPILRGVADKVGKLLITPQIDAQLAYIDDELAKMPWFAGERFSAADIMMSFPLEAAAARVGLGKRHSRIAAFLQRIHARPAYRRALERGGPYAIIGAE
ncbi:glutathione S-transferase [Xanthomonadaceae bacterium XH05]|nr:glutathione S-transferase [Xanthomonadaceae bacterium XH05]